MGRANITAGIHEATYEWLRREGPVARDREFIPEQPAQLTADWVTEAMHTAGELASDTRVASIEMGPLTGEGAGMTGVLVRLEVEYEGPSPGPPSLIAKFASDDRLVKGMLEHLDSYGREIHFYRDLAQSVPVRTPRHFGSSFDDGRLKDRPGLSRVVDALPARVQLALSKDVSKFMRASKRRYALLIEDMGADTIVCNAVSPPSVDKLEAVLDALAELHARYWGGSSVTGHPSLGHLVTRTPKLYRNDLRGRTLALAQQRWSEWWTNGDTELAKDAADRLRADVAKVNESITLVHGDPRSDNILFAESGPPVFIDWALQSVGHPGWDVSYLLGSSLAADSVRHADDLIAGYHAAVTSHGATISAEDLRAGYMAGLRSQAVQQVLSVRIIPPGYGDVALHDLWMPRLLALLRHEHQKH